YFFIRHQQRWILHRACFGVFTILDDDVKMTTRRDMMRKFAGIGMAILLAGASVTNAVAAETDTQIAKPGTAVTITSATKEFSQGLQGEIEKIVASHHGVMGVYYHNLE